MRSRCGTGTASSARKRPTTGCRPRDEQRRRRSLGDGDDAGERPRARDAERRARAVQAGRDAGAEQLPLVAFQLAEQRGYDEFGVASQLAAERGWMVPADTLPPNAEHVTIMRALVKQTLGRTLVMTLADDLADACETLERKGGLHELDRTRVKPGTGY